jgi:hypothetical protein
MEPSPPVGDSENAKPEKDSPKSDNNEIGTVVAALVKINRANRKADGAEYERNHSREKRRFVIEIIEVSLIFVYAIFTIMEWNTFNSERETMETELREAKDQRVLEERAWLMPSYPRIETNKTGTNFICYIPFINTGKTPALQVQDVIGQGNVLSGIPQPASEPTNNLRFGFVSPGGEYNIAIDTGMLRQNATEWVSKGGDFYFYGIIYYSDIFGSRHWTRFCYGRNPDHTEWTFGPQYNDCDIRK